MGKRREPFNGSIGNLLTEVEGEVESLKEELEEWYNNLPESFQNGDKGNDLNEAVSELEGILEAVQGAAAECSQHGVDDEVVKYTQDKRKQARSRSHRLDNMGMIVGAVQAYLEKRDNNTALSDALDYLRDAEDAMSSVSFPGMY